MQTTTKRAIALARTAGALSGIAFISADRTPEQQNAFTAFNAECVKRSLDPASTYADASQADAATRKPQTTSKPDATSEQPKAKRASAKPEKPSKPADAAKAAAYAERVKLIGALRDLVANLYNGPSLAVRTNAKRYAATVYSELLAAPRHRTTLAKLSVRDESALFLCLKRGDKAGAFDPVALNLDAGIFSRLASVGFIAASGDGFALTADALAHARKAAKRAA